MEKKNISDLPEGWTERRLREVVQISPRHPKALDPSLRVSFVPMSNVNESSWKLNLGEERELGKIRNGYTHFADGDVLFAKITPCMENGKAAVAEGLTNGLGCGTTELHVLRPQGSIESKYLYYFLHQDSFRQAAARNFTGTAGQLRVPTAFIQESHIPLPTINEQRRIVAKLEELLGKVEACQTRLAKIPVILKRFRQSVLAAACSGRLTADWRAEQNAAEDLEYTTVGEIAEYVGGFAYKSPTFIETGRHQVIRIGNVRPLVLSLTASPVFIPASIASETQRFSLLPNDLVISMTGTKYKRDYGYAAIVRESDGSLYLNQRVARLRCGEKAVPKFLLYWLQTDFFREFFFAGETGNVNQGNVGADGIREAPIELPSLAEQQEIVRGVEALFALADELEARYVKAHAHVDNMTQSILAKAFRGELVLTEAKLARRQGRDYEPA